MDFHREISARLIGVVTVLWCTAMPVLSQEEPTQTQIINALNPKNRRAMPLLSNDPERAAQERRIIDNAMHPPGGRGLQRLDREQLAAVAKEKPQIDLEIYFDYDSARITPQSMQALSSLGKALTAPELSGSVFMLAGHTDAKGGAEYNLRLSEQRAAAVKQTLTEKFNVLPNSLFAVGYGKEQLKDPEHSFDGKNRRVQVVTMMQKSSEGPGNGLLK
jgi:outer membrane protein OmpA-like peptidoglycan-associated protein